MSAIAASIEGYIRATKESSGEVVTVLKQGYLLKRSSGMRREWKRRFFVLDSLGCLYYYSNKVTAGVPNLHLTKGIYVALLGRHWAL